MKKYKVLVTYVEAGMGHIVSAEAIANALQKYYPDEIEVEKFYIFRDSNNETLKKYEKFLIKEVKQYSKDRFHLWVQCFFQKILTPMGTLKFVHSTVYRKQKKAAIKLLKAADADMVLNTHFATLHFSVEAKRRGGAKFIAACYNPDPNVHAWWDNRSDLFIVNNNLAYREAIDKIKFKESSVFEGKFILREDVKNAPCDKLFYRRKFGISEDAFTVCVADGAYATAKLKACAEKLIAANKKFTLIIIAGKNEEVYNHFNAVKDDCGNVTVQVYPFMKNAYELYCAADLFLTKAGPNAILDSVYMGTPVMTDYYSGPIELATKQLFVDTYGLGMHVSTAHEAVDKIGEILSDQSILDIYRENCVAFRKNITGEKAIADKIMQTLKAADNRPE